MRVKALYLNFASKLLVSWLSALGFGCLEVRSFHDFRVTAIDLFAAFAMRVRYAVGSKLIASMVKRIP